MEKRTEKNKNLYLEIDKRIEEKKKKVENSSFDTTQSTLSSINPDLFGSSTTKKEIKKEDKKHNLAIPIILGIIIIVGLVVFAIWKIKD